MYKNNDLKCNDGDEDGDHGDEDEDDPGELLPSLRRTRDKLLRLPAWDLMMMMMTVSCHLNYFVAFLKHCHCCSRVVRGDVNFEILRDPLDFLILIDPDVNRKDPFWNKNGSFLLTKALFWVNFCPFRATGRKGRG